MEEPETDIWFVVGGEPHLARQTLEVLQRLRGHVIEVDQMPNGVQHREEQGRARSYLVELYVRVQRDVLVYGVLLELRYEIPRHGQE